MLTPSAANAAGMRLTLVPQLYCRFVHVSRTSQARHAGQESRGRQGFAWTSRVKTQRGYESNQHGFTEAQPFRRRKGEGGQKLINIETCLHNGQGCISSEGSFTQLLAAQSDCELASMCALSRFVRTMLRSKSTRISY